MMRFLGKRSSVAALVACGFLSLPITTAWAADSCLKADNPCDPDKLCTFQSELAAKTLTYWTFRNNRNSNGPLYREAMAEATGTGAAKLVNAGKLLQDKVRAQVQATFRDPPCNGGGMVQESLLPKKGYEGMHTDENCAVFADYQKAPYDAKGFGSSDATSCPEFYDRDRAHEVIHQQRCNRAKDSGKSEERFAIDRVAREEMIAYNHSVKLSRAYVRLLSLQCSAARTPQSLQARAEKIQQWLAPYQGKLK